MPDNTVTAKGRSLGAALRRAREDRWPGSLRDFASKVNMDHALLSKIETGKRRPSRDTVVKILTRLDVDLDQYNEIVGMLEGADATQWLAVSLPERRQQQAALLDFEDSAKVIIENATMLIPGIAQTRRYARATISGGTLPADEISTRVSTRLGRRDVITRKDPVRLVLLIHEAALRNVIGGVEVLIEQLEYLLELEAWSNVELRVVPHCAGWHPGLEGAFALIDPRDAEDGFSVVFLENRLGGLILDAEEDVAAYRQAVDVVLQKAMSPVDSTGLIGDVIKGMRTG